MARFSRQLAAAALCALAATGCAGSSHALPPAGSAATSAPAATTGTARFSVLIPNRVTTSSARNAAYISASTLSGQIVVNGATITELDLGVGSPLCTTATTGRTCLINAPAPAGNPTFALKLYDGAYTSGAHSGNLLSTAAGFSAPVTEGASNVTTPLVLSGVPAFYALTVAQQPAARATTGASSSGVAVLTVYDRQLNVIVGPGTYANAAGTTTGFTVVSPSANYRLTLNSGGPASSIHVTAPSDVIGVSQIAAALGGELTTTADVGTTTQLGKSVFVRPTGFAAADTEAAFDASGASGSQLAPISDQTYGVGGLPNYAAVGLFTTDATAATATTCGTGFTRQPDMAIAVATAWTTQSNTVFTYDLASCNANPQFPGMTDVGVGSGIVEIDPSCVANFQYPGVFISAGSGAPANCTGPHDITTTNDHNGKYAAIETNSVDTNDHVAVYNGLTFAADIAVTNTFGTAAGLSLVSIAARSDNYFVEELPNARLWQVSQPGIAPAALQGFLPLPGGYTYVNNTHVSPATVTWSNRSMAIGADGYAYIAVSSPFNGVIVVDPATTALVRQLPNSAGVSGVAPFNVAADRRGTIYWSAGGYVMHYPSSVSAS